MFAVILGAILLGSVLWWAWADRLLRPYRILRIFVAVFVAAHLLFLASHFVVPGIARRWHHWIPAPWLATVYLWHLLVVPLSLILSTLYGLTPRRRRTAEEILGLAPARKSAEEILGVKPKRSASMELLGYEASTSDPYGDRKHFTRSDIPSYAESAAIGAERGFRKHLQPAGYSLAEASAALMYGGDPMPALRISRRLPL